MKGLLLTLKVFHNFKSSFQDKKMFPEAMFSRTSSNSPLTNMIDYMKKPTSHRKLHLEIDQLTKNQNKGFLNINQHLNNMLLYYQDQAVKCFKEFHLKNLVMSTHNKIFCISALLASVSAFVHNVLFMVYFLL
jgi:dTDP-4-dehydrorhamnose reductase